MANLIIDGGINSIELRDGTIFDLIGPSGGRLTVYVNGEGDPVVTRSKDGHADARTPNSCSSSIRTEDSSPYMSGALEAHLLRTIVPPAYRSRIDLDSVIAAQTSNNNNNNNNGQQQRSRAADSRDTGEGGGDSNARLARMQGDALSGASITPLFRGLQAQRPGWSSAL